MMGFTVLNIDLNFCISLELDIVKILKFKRVFYLTFYKMADTPKITVIGGSNIDLIGFSKEKLIFKDSNTGSVETILGGVGRKMACISRKWSCVGQKWLENGVWPYFCTQKHKSE